MQWIDHTLQDLRYAARSWRSSPGFLITAVATLALGIGANTAIFSVVSGVLLKPLPYATPEDLVQINAVNQSERERNPRDLVIWQDLEEWRSHSRLFESMAGYLSTSRIVQGAGDPVRAGVISGEPGLMAMLGVPALAGRTFAEGDPYDVAVASYGFWKNQLSGDPAVVGRRIALDEQPFTIIGVMPEHFHFPNEAAAIDLWVPWDAPPVFRTRPNGRIDTVIGRIKPQTSIAAARQELSGMQGPATGGREAVLTPLKEIVSGPVERSLLVLLGAVGMVLLVACVNVANLLLARTASRQREIAIRGALGASRFRLLRQFLTESLLLALTGGIAGLAIGIWARRTLVAVAADQIPRAGEIGLDWRVFAFLLAVCIATGIVFGLAPGIEAARGSDRALKSRSTTSAPRDVLVVVEIALAFVLLAGAGLLARTFVNLQRTSPGVEPENVLTAHVTVVSARESIAIRDRVAQLPGVRSVGLVSFLPLQNSGWTGGFTVEGRPGVHQTELRYVTPGYFGAMGIPILRGRDFSDADVPGLPISIVVNETLARLHFPNEDPVGRKTSRGTIVGVVRDVRQGSLSQAPMPETYYTVVQNFAQLRRVGSTIVVRAAGAPESLVSAVRRAVREVNPNQAVFSVATMKQVVSESLANQRLYAWLLGLFALMATLLAVAGIYGVIAYLVTLRTREFGIRMALGAGASGVLRLVLQRGAVLVAIGLGAGIAGASILTRVLGSLLYGVEAVDPLTFSAMAVLLAAAAISACLVPARRAAQVDPSVALRIE
jgi:predicted permease